MRIDAGTETESRILRGLLGDVLVWDEKLGPVAIQFAIVSDHAVHREDDRRPHPLTLLHPLGQALDQQLIPLGLHLRQRHAERLEVNVEPEIIPQFLGHKATTPPRTDAGRVTMHVENWLRIPLGHGLIRAGKENQAHHE